MALSSVLRMFRLPVVVLSLALFIGLFLLTTSDAWAYAAGLPAKEMEQELVDGDPDLPAGFHAGDPGSAQEPAGSCSLLGFLKAVWELARLVP